MEYQRRALFIPTPVEREREDKSGRRSSERVRDLCGETEWQGRERNGGVQKKKASDALHPPEEKK
jgi:hypothetical protein